MSDMLEGGCACGAVRYRVSGDPVFVNNCHCTLCQRQTGGGSAVNAFYESERLTVLHGEPREHKVPTGSGKVQTIIRCAQCGCALWSHYPGLGKHGVAVRAGTLDDSSAIRPDAAIYVADRMKWVALPEGVPAFEGYYKPADLLAPERMARLKAIAAKASVA